MSYGARSNVRTVVATLSGIFFTLAAFVLAAGAAGKLLDALMVGNPHVMRVGIFAVGLVVSAVWTYIGVEWVADDVADLRTIDRLRVSKALS